MTNQHEHGDERLKTGDEAAPEQGARAETEGAQAGIEAQLAEQTRARVEAETRECILKESQERL